MTNVSEFTSLTDDQLLEFVGGGAQPGSPTHELAKAILASRRTAEQLRAAHLATQAAASQARWTAVQGVASAAGTMVAVVALLVAVF